MGRLRAAIVGAGLMGHWHARYLRRAGGEVAAIVDRNLDAAAALGRKYPQARTFDKLTTCLALCPVDVVHVCTGVETHVALTETALLADKHVVVEKPFAPSAASAWRLLALARSRALKVIAVHQFPAQRGFQRVCQRLDRLGELVRVSHQICSAGGGPESDERRQVLLGMLPHPLSLFRRLAGEGIDGAGWQLGRFTDTELEATCTVQATSFHVLLSVRGRPTRNELTVVGSRGTAHVDLFHGWAVFETGTVSWREKIARPFGFGLAVLGAAGWNLVGRVCRWEPAYPGLADLLGQFYQAIRSGGPPPVSPEEVVASVALIEYLRSLASGGPPCPAPPVPPSSRSLPRVRWGASRPASGS